ncbi:hypothetical protein FNF29_04820 [Cafeteria roenbergensis]|uniref:Uncharacterized protein n=1 Tax=Cafeteria roenbergensis TaxID=33653 RepID=A0A5A8CEK6_CAFRO|nr:hypothetical protein FNF29_04820 [Cafeteria roenbergensis]|eukprot:KAA0151129.1 hypothetical protein FNF29_04820 [Cafeteria roenbergensis]
MRTMKRVVVKLTSDLVEGCHEERIHKIVGPELAPKVVESGMMAMTGAADRQVLSVATSASEPSPLTRGDITFLSGGQAPRWEDRHSSDPDRAPEPLLWHEALDGGSHDTGARVFGHPLWAPASPLPAICVPTHLAGPEQCSAVLAHAYRTANQLLDAQPDLWDDAHKEAFQQLTSEELASRLTGVARLVYRPPANAERPAAVLGHVCGFREDSAVLSGALAKLNRLRTGLAPSEPAVLQARDRLLGYSLGRIDERSLVHDSGAKLKLAELQGRHGADMQLHVLANVSDVSASHEWDALLDLENAAPLGRAASAAGADSLAIPPASATAKRVCSSPSLSSASMVTLALPEDSDSVKTAIAALEKLRRASSTAQITVFHAKCTTAIRGLAKADLQMVAKRLAPQLRRGRRGKLESALIAHFTPVGRESPAVAAEAHPGNGKPFVTTSGRRPIADAESTTCAWLRYETHEALESVRPFLALNSCQRLKEASYCRVLGKVSSTPHFDVVVTTSDREQTSTGADQALRGIKDVLGFSGSHVHHVPDLRLGDLGGCGAAAAASHAAAARPTTVLEKPSSTFVVLAHGMEASLDEDTSESLASSRGGLCLDLDTVDDEFARQLAGTLASVPGGQSFLQAILVVACNSESTARSLSSLPCLSHVAVLGFEGKISVALSRRFLEEFFRSAKLQCVESSLLACDVERHTRSALSALNAHSMEHAGVPLLCGNFDLASSFVQARFPAGSFSGFGASVLTAVMRPRLYINGEARDIGKPYEFRTADELRELLVEAVGRSGARANDEVCDIQAMLAAPRLGCF